MSKLAKMNDPRVLTFDHKRDNFSGTDTSVSTFAKRNDFMRTDKHAFFLTTHAEIQITVDFDFEKLQHSIVFRFHAHRQTRFFSNDTCRNSNNGRS